jgi:hypothetical protein
VTAAVPAAELACHFDEDDVWRWRRHMGRLCHPLAAVDLYALDHNESGCHLSDRTLRVPVCIYIAVDDADACLYIGQCRRPDSTIVVRIDGHHAIPSFATGLWVLPLSDDCPADALDRIERRMIEAYHPPYNTVFCPTGFRAGDET